MKRGAGLMVIDVDVDNLSLCQFGRRLLGTLDGTGMDLYNIPFNQFSIELGMDQYEWSTVNVRWDGRIASNTSERPSM